MKRGNEVIMKIGDRILKFRKKSHLSQCDLANKLNISRQSISLWETDQTIPSIDNLISLANIFNVSLDELCGNKIKKQNYNLAYLILDQLLLKKDYKNIEIIANEIIKDDPKQYKAYLYLLLKAYNLNSFKELGTIENIKDNELYKKALSNANKKEKEELTKIVNTPFKKNTSFQIPKSKNMYEEMREKAKELEQINKYSSLKRSYEISLVIRDEESAKRINKKLKKYKAIFYLTLTFFVIVILLIILLIIL